MNNPDAVSGYTILSVSPSESLLTHPITKIVSAVDAGLVDLLKLCDGTRDEAALAQGLNINIQQVVDGLDLLRGLGFLVVDTMPTARFAATTLSMPVGEGEETLLYVPELKTAFNLSKAAAIVYSRCNGTDRIIDVAKEIESAIECEQGEGVVSTVLAELGENYLVERQPFVSKRRQFLLGTAKMAAALPFVMSALAPSPAHASSACITGCTPNNGCAACVGNCGVPCGLLDCTAVPGNTCANFVMVIGGNTVFAADGQRCAQDNGATFVNDCATGCGGAVTVYNCCVGTANNGPGANCVFCGQNQAALCLSNNCTGGVCA